MTTTTPNSPAPSTAHTFTGPDARQWDLDRPLLDWHADGWQWDGQPYTAAAGPVLRASGRPERTERLVALACCSGLWQPPLDAPGDLAHLLDPQDVLFRTGIRNDR